MKNKELKPEFTNIHQDLIKRSQEGDGDAQNKLYMLYSKAMFNTCLRITNNYDDAEDVLQEAFVSAFKNLLSFRSDSSFGAWLKRIVINKAINHVKKKHLEVSEFDIERHDLTIHQDEQIDYNENTFEVNRIREAMKNLPEGYRLVFSLYLLEGYDHQEIAGILGISESTSKSQYNRAKKKLRELLIV